MGQDSMKRGPMVAPTGVDASDVIEEHARLRELEKRQYDPAFLEELASRNPDLFAQYEQYQKGEVPVPNTDALDTIALKQEEEILATIGDMTDIEWEIFVVDPNASASTWGQRFDFWYAKKADFEKEHPQALGALEEWSDYDLKAVRSVQRYKEKLKKTSHTLATHAPILEERGVSAKDVLSKMRVGTRNEQKAAAELITHIYEPDADHFQSALAKLVRYVDFRYPAVKESVQGKDQPAKQETPIAEQTQSPERTRSVVTSPASFRNYLNTTAGRRLFNIEQNGDSVALTLTLPNSGPLWKNSRIHHFIGAPGSGAVYEIPNAETMILKVGEQTATWNGETWIGGNGERVLVEGTMRVTVSPAQEKVEEKSEKTKPVVLEEVAAPEETPPMAKVAAEPTPKPSDAPAARVDRRDEFAGLSFDEKPEPFEFDEDFDTSGLIASKEGGRVEQVKTPLLSKESFDPEAKARLLTKLSKLLSAAFPGRQEERIAARLQRNLERKYKTEQLALSSLRLEEGQLICDIGTYTEDPHDRPNWNPISIHRIAVPADHAEANMELSDDDPSAWVDPGNRDHQRALRQLFGRLTDDFDLGDDHAIPNERVEERWIPESAEDTQLMAGEPSYDDTDGLADVRGLQKAEDNPS